MTITEKLAAAVRDLTTTAAVTGSLTNARAALAEYDALRSDILRSEPFDWTRADDDAPQSPSDPAPVPAISREPSRFWVNHTDVTADGRATPLDPLERQCGPRHADPMREFKEAAMAACIGIPSVTLRKIAGSDAGRRSFCDAAHALERLL